MVLVKVRKPSYLGLGRYEADSPAIGPGSLTCGFLYQIWIIKNKPEFAIATNAAEMLTLFVMFAVNMSLKNFKEILQIQSKNCITSVFMLKSKSNRVIEYHMSYVAFAIICYAAVRQTKR